MLESINLSTSSVCGANCIYCPSNRGKNIKQKIMPLDYAKTIIYEISSEDFRKQHNIKRIEVGENGDAFLNKNLIEILRFIKSLLPQIKVELFTNFQHFSAEKAEVILKEKLVDSITCNIDGSSKENYFNIKKLDLENTRKKLNTFLELRRENGVNVQLRISVITLHNYIHTIYKYFHFYPAKLEDSSLFNIPDDLSTIKKRLKKRLDPKRDTITKEWICAWAEREKVNLKAIDYKKYVCPNLFRIKKEAYIAPDGSWYICCLDSNNELVLGNVIDQSINTIFFSERRNMFIEFLRKRKFEMIGGPCETVNCCQSYHKNRFLFTLSQVILKHEFLTDVFYQYLYNPGKKPLFYRLLK